MLAICLLKQCFNYCVQNKHYKHYISSTCNLLTFNYKSVLANITKGCDYDRHFVLHFCSLQKSDETNMCWARCAKAHITGCTLSSYHSSYHIAPNEVSMLTRFLGHLQHSSKSLETWTGAKNGWEEETLFSAPGRRFFGMLKGEQQSARRLSLQFFLQWNEERFEREPVFLSLSQPAA